jgi:hypothetical protein
MKNLTATAAIEFVNASNYSAKFVVIVGVYSARETRPKLLAMLERAVVIGNAQTLSFTTTADGFNIEQD